MNYNFKDTTPHQNEPMADDNYYTDFTELDKSIEYSLTELSELIKTKGNGKAVRDIFSLAFKLIEQIDGIEDYHNEKYGEYYQQFNDVIKELSEDKDYHSLPEIAGARGGFGTLGERLNDTTAQLVETNSKKVDKDGSQQVKWANIAQDAREQISGDKVAVVGKDSVGTENLTDNAVTYDKTDFADEVSFRIKNKIYNGNFTEDSDGDGWADGFVRGGDNVESPRVEGNSQYWTPLNNLPSGSLRTASDNQPTFLAKHKYYISIESKNVSKIRHGTVNTIDIGVPDGHLTTIISYEHEVSEILSFDPVEENIESSISNLVIVDLTDTFGKGNEPDIGYFEFLLSQRGIYGWFDVANLADMSKKTVLSAKDLDVYDPDNSLNYKNTNDVLLDLNSKVIEAGNIQERLDEIEYKNSIRIKNKIINGNFAEDSDGNGWADGFVRGGDNVDLPRVENNTQYWTPLSTFASGALRTNSDNNPTVKANHMHYISAEFRNIRRIRYDGNTVADGLSDGVYSGIMFYDEDTDGIMFFDPLEANVEASISNLIIADLTETFGKGNEPDIGYFDFLLRQRDIHGWFDEVNLADMSENPLITAKELKVYDPQNNLSSQNTNDVLLDLNSRVMEAENIQSRLDEIEYKIENLDNVGGGGEEKEFADRQFITLNDKGNEHKLILHLHKREKEAGFGEYNNAYLPNADDDLSDVRIMTDKGRFLPTKTVYQADDFDIVPYDWTFEPSQNSVTRQDRYGVLYQSQAYMRKSEDKGHTWVNIPAFEHMHNPQLNIIDENDVMYFNHDSKLYRSEYPYTDYEMVFDLDPSSQYPSVRVDAKGLVKHPDGELFCGLYQTPRHIRFYKSTDNGFTWELSADFGDVHQHIHGMYIDTYANPPAVYGGADKTGGVYKTTDKGETWVDLRELYPDMPQSTDYGVRYADPSGYRLLGGETAVVGGHSIIKTYDDETFRPVLSDGTSVNEVFKDGDRMFATGSGGHSHRNGAIYISRDNAETWESIYRTSVITDLWSANDGYRYLEQISENELFIGPQSLSRPPLLLTLSGSYAEVIVDVPSDAEYLIVESSRRKRLEHSIVNDVEFEGDKVVHFELNEGGNTIAESVSGNTFTGNFKWMETGRHLSYFYPYIIADSDKHSVVLNSLTGYEIDIDGFDTTGGFTISFWLKRAYDGRVVLLESENGDKLEINKGFQMHLNNRNIVSYGGPTLPEATMKYDIVFDGQGGGEMYNNGLSMTTSYVRDYAELSNMLSVGGVITFLKNVSSDDNHAMQHFMIRKGMIDEQQLLDEYNGLVRDNIDQ